MYNRDLQLHQRIEKEFDGSEWDRIGHVVGWEGPSY